MLIIPAGHPVKVPGRALLVSDNLPFFLGAGLPGLQGSVRRASVYRAGTQTGMRPELIRDWPEGVPQLWRDYALAVVGVGEMPVRRELLERIDRLSRWAQGPTDQRRLPCRLVSYRHTRSSPTTTARGMLAKVRDASEKEVGLDTG